VYLLQSQLRFTDNLGGGVSAAVKVLTDLSTGLRNPGAFVQGLIAAQIRDGFLRLLFNVTAGTVIQFEINQLLGTTAPAFVQDLGQIVATFSAFLNDIRLGSRLTCSAGASATCAHELRAIALGGGSSAQAVQIEFASAGLQFSPASFTATVGGNGAVTLAEHTLSLDLGQVVLLAVNRLIIPQIRQGATSLTDLIGGVIDCSAIGRRAQSVQQALLSSVIVNACVVARTVLVDRFENAIRGINGTGASLKIAGTAQLAPGANGGGLSNGVWSGQLKFGPGQEACGGTSCVFTAERVRAQ
jgi:hypothetical protein